MYINPHVAEYVHNTCYAACRYLTWCPCSTVIQINIMTMTLQKQNYKYKNHKAQICS